ncbi:hypothetical protein [Azoarcus sp. KH32C]|uniref:hypothetical protein n=1 Tax=Azoarcus sp. KH32C TaxID=748247 RepID=UPI0002385FE6|nr:hypothetical protein [Azoarcus sp. KH32C]BAL24016.1 hypothetical protein AZKH_1701 [Azoarcus sp. KH32C]
MRKALILVAASLALSGSASAACVGTGNYSSCYDANTGNSYSVQRYGNTTYMQGSNPNGSTWSQNSTTVGNTTLHTGTAANGNSWSGTSTHIGNTTINSGMDSRGNPYSSTCVNGYCN